MPLLTIFCDNTFSAGDDVLLEGLTEATFLNGQTVTVTSATSTSFTALFSGNGGFNYDLTSDTGTAETTGTVPSDATLQVSLISPAGDSPTFSIQLPVSAGSAIAGGPTETWGLGTALTPGLLNDSSFGFNIQAFAPGGQPIEFAVSGVELIASLTPNPPQNFNYIKTFASQSGTDLTLLIDNAGIGWQENVFANPNVLDGFYLNFEPGCYAKSVTFEEHEYIALSNLTEGVDMPRQYDGVNVDRISQCGPGVTPACSGMSGTAGTQAVVDVTLTNVNGVPTATVTTQQPIPGLEIGNQFTITGNSNSFWNATWTVSGTPNAATLEITQTSLLGGVANYTYVLVTGAAPVVGSQVTVTGCTNGPTVGGLSIFDLANALVSSATANTFSVLIPGVPDVPPAAEEGAATSAGTIFQFLPGLASPGPAWNQNINGHTTDNTVVWVNLGVAVPWTANTSWTGVTYAAVNGTNLTSLMWDAPTGCFFVNGTGDGYRAGGHSGNSRPNFNPSPGTFTRGDGEIDWFNIGTPYLNPTQCQFWEANQTQPAGVLTPYVLEPNGNIPLPGGTYDENTAPVYLQMPFNFNSARVTASEEGTGGILMVVGQQATNLGAGLRGVVLLFETRNGYITGPSPFIQFNTNEGTTQISAKNIAVGPPDCTARILAFTAANGSYYYYIPSPVTVISNSQTITYTPTVINDNVTTSATFTFTDAVLTGAGSVEIDVPGYNLFSLIELGDCVGIIDYQGRLFAWGEENKVQNFNNLSFNGGYVSTGVAVLPLLANGYVPAGWTQDADFGGGVNLSISPLFGNSLYIQNGTDSTQGTYGMIEQSAYQDIYNVNILNSNFTYGARVVARCPSQIGAGSLVVDLYSPSFMRVFGSYTIPLASMGTTMSRFIGNVLTTAFPISIPADLILRVYATGLPSGGDVELDHLEIFPLQQPVLQNQFRASYANEPEMYDGVTGNCGPAQDNKPIGGAVTLFDNLYCLKRDGGTYVTNDNGITEPSEWSWKTVSTNIGTMGPNSYDYGENWFLTADRKGLYGYGGGPLEKMSQEIQPVWNMITNYPATVVRNDQYERRILIFACIPTPNQYMPEMPVNPNPTIPNVCLACNYRENDSLEALISAKPVRQTIMGTVRAFDFVRKWSYWNVSSPYADFCERADGTEQLLICNGVENSKVYLLSPNQFSDDGAAINSYYITYGFVRPDMQEAKGLGLGEMQLGLGRFLVSGNGTLYIADYPDDPQSPDVQWYFPLPLASVGGPTVEAPLNDIGSRFFIRVGTNAVGHHFLLSKMVVTMDPAPWDSVKGVGN